MLLVEGAHEGPSEAWLRRMADAEDRCPSVAVGSVAVGGLANKGADKDDVVAFLRALIATARHTDNAKGDLADMARDADWLLRKLL